MGVAPVVSDIEEKFQLESNVFTNLAIAAACVLRLSAED